MENINTPQDLFVNIRKSIRLLYEYQKRMQGTMFHIKSVLGLSKAGRIEVNKLFSLAPRASKEYGATQLGIDNWAWDYIYPMVMEYYLGEKKISKYDFRLSAIQVTDDGYYQAMQHNQSVKVLDTYTFSLPEESNSIVLFIMEIKQNDSSWTKRWNPDTMENNLYRWVTDSQTIIEDIIEHDNYFIVMKFSITDLLSETSIGDVLHKISKHVEKVTGIKIM